MSQSATQWTVDSDSMSATARGMRSTGCDDKADLDLFAKVRLF